MRRLSCCLLAMAVASGTVQARGIVIPVEKNIPPLALLHHRVQVDIDDQVAVTRVTQTFRNHTRRNLEATYVFPVPKGANVQEFAMWVNGKKVKAELLEADKAKRIYTDIVRRTQDPALLRYLGQDLLQMQIFPIPPQQDQRIEVTYTSVCPKDHGIVEYCYPLRTDHRAVQTLNDFTMKITLRSQQPILNIYSPTHAIELTRKGDGEAIVSFEKDQAVLDHDFQLFYTTDSNDVGMTALLHRPISSQPGYFMLLISPRPKLAQTARVPRDMVFVLDTSGSMRQDGKLDQAKKALKHCLDGLAAGDRFAIVRFATVVDHFRNELSPVDDEHRTAAKKWIDELTPSGGTAIQDALLAALQLQDRQQDRPFTVVFFTDGKPTIGETNTDKILAAVRKHNTDMTRIFTFGVGHDLNASFLDLIAEGSRGISTFVRPKEDLEVKVSSFFDKISHPVLANLELKVVSGARLSEIYPPQLPDLFHGGQLVVLGRYEGAGPTAIRLTGTIGGEQREFVYETDFLPKADDRPFVEDLWARRKVGYLLEQIRLNGEKKELVEEVTLLAKRYGIATPYTSYLIVPDEPVPLVGGGGGGVSEGKPSAPPILLKEAGGRAAARPLADFAKGIVKAPGGVGRNRDQFENDKLSRAVQQEASGGEKGAKLRYQFERKQVLDETLRALKRRDHRWTQNNRAGVVLSIECNQLKAETQLRRSAVRRVANNRQCVEIGGVWIDDRFHDKTPLVNVKAQSEAYFRILERHPEVKDVFALGNYVVWVTPSGTALVIDLNAGLEKLTDAEIDRLFVVKRHKG